MGLVLKGCLGHRPGETLCVVSDDAMAELAASFVAAATRLGIETATVTMSPRQTDGEEPPAPVAAALESAHVAVILTAKSLTHTQARRRASERGARIASMPGADGSRLERLLDIDYAELGRRCWKVAERLGRGKRLRVTSAAGTDLECAIEGRAPCLDTGVFDSAGAFGNLPAGEVCVAPLEGTVNGIAVIDGSMAGLGRLPEPLRLVVRDGRVVDTNSPALRAMLGKAGPQAFLLGEIGIGLNPRAEVVGNVLEDEKAIGTAHVALGDNLSFGGANQVPLHLDGVLVRPRVFVDGVELTPEDLGWVVRDGAGSAAGSPAPTALPPAAAPSEQVHGASGAPPPAGVGAGDSQAYHLLFQHSNDAQYVLDLETQAFVEVNARFEQLTGYSREELLDPAMRVSKLIARESRTTYERKIQDRRTVTSERYDLRMLCKNGDKRPVEISVKKITLGSREVIIGAVRDLTERKRFEQELWQRIEELGNANKRIYALTEKIRPVPTVASQLLHVTDEEDLFARAAKLLCERQGLAYLQVDFYLVQGDVLELRYSTHLRGTKRHRLDSSHRLTQVLQGGHDITARGAALPLKGRDRNLGVLAIEFDPKEVELLSGNEQALKGYHDLLVTLSNVVGLLIDNLRLYEKVRVQSIVDELTGVYNRRFFDTKFVDEVHRARRYARELSMMMIDLDNFKAINDSLGHKQGDIVLAEAAKIFRGQTRDVDIVCRYGGDEFAVLMPETAKENAAAKAEQLRDAVKKHPFPNLKEPGRPLTVSLSIGVTSFKADSKSDEDILRSADEALYTAKREGRDRVAVL